MVKHKNGHYVPLSEKEQDVVQRMLENEDLYVQIVDWGYHPSPKITAGDKRVQIRFPMEFNRPVGLEIPVRYFRLRLKMRNGRTVAEKVESTVYNNQPLYITAGMRIDLVWDLALDSISEEVQNMILPKIRGKKVSTIKNGKLVKNDSQEKGS